MLGTNSGVPRIFFGGGSTNSVEDRGHREQRSGAVTPLSGVPPSLQMGETHILIRFLRSIFHRTGNSARLCQNIGIISGGFEPPKPPLWVRQWVPTSDSEFASHFQLKSVQRGAYCYDLHYHRMLQRQPYGIVSK
jgi:hypothetical protein